MTRKKIVFVIVEGMSDETALGLILSKIYDENKVHIHIMRKDITTEKGVDTSNIVGKIGDVVKQYAKTNHFSKVHFQEIIHLVDTDGAYIPDANILEDDTCVKPQYNLAEIRTANRKGIISRNQQKRDNLDKICERSEIWGLPYHIYFMSCNLDHVLYDKLNSTDKEKEEDAYAFAKKYKDDLEGFVDYIAKSAFSVMCGYKESWKFIRCELHSLQRHTNFGLCFLKPEFNNDKIISSDKQGQ